jgi:hypothetical protein
MRLSTGLRPVDLHTQPASKSLLVIVTPPDSVGLTVESLAVAHDEMSVNLQQLDHEGREIVVSL